MEIPVFEDSSPVYFLAISLGTSLQVYYWSLGKLVLKKLNRLRFDPSWVLALLVSFTPLGGSGTG